MSLKNRLRTLKRQSGQEPAAQPAESRTDRPVSLAERVQRLRPGGLSAGAGAAPPVQKRTPEEVAAMVQGRLIQANTILTEQRIPLSGRHGDFPLERLRERVKLPDFEGDSPEGLLFVDTETTGLSGGSGTVAFMLGMARVQGDALEIRQITMTGFSGEAALLEAGAEWLSDARGFVSFNGKSFDLPLLAGRCRMVGMEDVFSPVPHLDLLYPTRRAYRTRWTDCRLSTAEKELLGFVRHNDLPGSEAPAAWFSYVHAGDATRLPDVVRHNRWDLLSLAGLLPRLSDVHAEPGRWAADTLAIARAHVKREDEAAARRLLEAHRPELDGEGLRTLALLYRRIEAWDSACEIWEELAFGGCAESLERLAKYHEHIRRDYDRALTFAERLPEGEGSRHRRRRLQQKINRSRP